VNHVFCKRADTQEKKIEDLESHKEVNIRKNRSQKVKKRILVVDDNEAMRVFLSDALSIFGHEVAVADCGADGFELFLQDKFDLVITDCQMLGIDGLHLTDLNKISKPRPLAVRLEKALPIQRDKIKASS